MTTIITSYQTALDTYLEPFADGLIAYANTDQVFAESLAALVLELPETPGRYREGTTATPRYFTPDTQESAVTVAAWLCKQLSLKPTRTRHTTARLLTWAEPYQAPKDQIFGIVGIAIIGPTLGLIKSKKKKKSRLYTVVSKHWQETHTTAEFTELVTRVNQEVIAHELKLANGNIYDLHPDTAAWCMEEAIIKLFVADDSELQKLAGTAKLEQLSHSTSREDKQLTAIAISPAITDSFLKDFAVSSIR
jgi:hypothetical protein